jgi:AbrB family looped-hinge helix DNA binding protein
MQQEPVIKTIVKVDVAGKVAIPAVIRRKVGIKEGQELEIRLLKSDAGWLIMLQEVK